MDEFQINGYLISVRVDEPFTSRLDSQIIAEAVTATLRFCERDAGEVSVLVTENKAVQALNRDFRGVDAPTDVLSFPANDNVSNDPILIDVPEEVIEELNCHLGDLVFALPYLEAQAQRYQITVHAELRLLAVHGTLHLLGYDHADDMEKSAMWAAQNAVLAQLGEAPHTDRDYD